MIVPSTGTRWPGFMTTISPATMDSLATSTSWPLRMTVAFLGVRSINLPSASPVLALDFDSKYFPIETNVKIMAEESKYNE